MDNGRSTTVTAMPWSANVTDTFFAPELSMFTAAEIPDMTSADDQQEHWLSNYLLNTVLRDRCPDPPVSRSTTSFVGRIRLSLTTNLRA